MARGRGGALPGGARRWEAARTERNTTPVWAPDAPQTPLPDPTPRHTRETRPPSPLRYPEETRSPPPRGQSHPPGDPAGETQSPLPEKSHVETPPKRLSWPTRALPPPGDSPHPGKKWLQRQGPPQERERYPRPPRRKDNSRVVQSCPKVLQVGDPRSRGAGRARDIPSRTCFRDRSLPWEGRWPTTDMP